MNAAPRRYVTLDNVSHTPGPWARDEQPTGQYAEQVVAKSPRGKKVVVARIGSGYERREHDARLIAAAPDLLAALKAVLAYEEDEINGPWPQAVAAIKKATGA